MIAPLPVLMQQVGLTMHHGYKEHLGLATSCRWPAVWATFRMKKLLLGFLLVLSFCLVQVGAFLDILVINWGALSLTSTSECTDCQFLKPPSDWDWTTHTHVTTSNSVHGWSDTRSRHKELTPVINLLHLGSFNVLSFLWFRPRTPRFLTTRPCRPTHMQPQRTQRWGWRVAPVGWTVGRRCWPWPLLYSCTGTETFRSVLTRPMPYKLVSRLCQVSL